MVAEILFVNHMEERLRRSVDVHEHTFWQLELLQAGDVEWLSELGVTTFSADQVLLLPPGVKHGFTYLGHLTKLVSIKFNWMDHMDKPDKAILYDLGESPLRLLVQSVFAYEFDSQAVQLKSMALNGVLNAILAHFVRPLENSADQLYIKIMNLVSTLEGRRLQVSELSEKLSMSVSHVSREFKKIHKKSLKNFIDDCTLAYAKKYLVYTGESVSHVSYLLGFPDVYSFSHFFKNHVGVGPRQYRLDNT